MEISINEISESEFKKLEIPVLFEDESIDRIFGVISDGKNEYKLGWQSENIKPVVKWINTILCSIGVDLVFVIFEFNTGRILYKLSLDYYFYDTRIYNGAIYVITQLEIIKISITDLTIAETYSLPDYFESIEFKQGILIVRCIGNEVVNIE
ncbi:hypothetical protein SAMN05192529_1242 [Arachidicoccus rhizosphaerae]|uniref:Uncharacterized protein n=1 Tax=Arachidicoccus rhizosphaerae TaxID=551991 RepID=A0A1H4BS47_9BACT|nr:hypothetical protein [Arachidicoccus rhizosphaerae]SEA50929.1 hypothetical protein SAMN05192529_1242 [Arachidicoccus rhizosphaerae]